MLKFGIMLYLVPIVFVKFNVKFDIALEKVFYAKMPNFGIGTQIWHFIGDNSSKEKAQNLQTKGNQTKLRAINNSNRNTAMHASMA